MTHIFDDRRCELGEGALWHPLCEQLFWFDIIGKRLLTRNAKGPQEWHFDDYVSAAGWVDRDTLLIASQSALSRFTLSLGTGEILCPLEADNHKTRSNDGRADPQGGFWASTMGLHAEPGAGTIYRFYKGELRIIFKDITIPNAICFTPDGKAAHFADTATGQVMRVDLDAEGWPAGRAQIFLDLAAQGLNPDGAVIDADGTLWLAQWGAGRVAAYGRDGEFLRAVTFDAPHTSCPAFGGSDMTTLFCTTAQQGLSASDRAAHPHSGKTFAAPGIARGQYEHMVIL